MGTAKVLRFFSRLQCLQILWITFNSEENFERFLGDISSFSGPLIPPCCGKQKQKQGKKQTKIKQTVPLFYNVLTEAN